MDMMKQIVQEIVEEQDEPMSLLKLSKIVSEQAKIAARSLYHDGILGCDSRWNIYMAEAPVGTTSAPQVPLSFDDDPETGSGVDSPW